MGRETVGLHLGCCLLIMMDTEEGEEVMEVMEMMMVGGTIRSNGTTIHGGSIGGPVFISAWTCRSDTTQITPTLCRYLSGSMAS